MNKKEETERITELIREGKKYKEVKEVMVNEGCKTDFHSRFAKLQQSVFPSKKLDKALEGSREKRVEEAKEKKKGVLRGKWSTKKQKEADESKLAELLNIGLYQGVFPLCKSHELKLEHVKEINLGGAIVGSITYYFPDIDLNHPLILLATRGIMFYIRFRQVCDTVREKIAEVQAKAAELVSGVKPEWKGAQK